MKVNALTMNNEASLGSRLSLKLGFGVKKEAERIVKNCRPLSIVVVGLLCRRADRRLPAYLSSDCPHCESSFPVVINVNHVERLRSGHPPAMPGNSGYFTPESGNHVQPRTRTD